MLAKLQPQKDTIYLRVARRPDGMRLLTAWGRPGWVNDEQASAVGLAKGAFFVETHALLVQPGKPDKRPERVWVMLPVNVDIECAVVMIKGEEYMVLRVVPPSGGLRVIRLAANNEPTAWITVDQPYVYLTTNPLRDMQGMPFEAYWKQQRRLP